MRRRGCSPVRTVSGERLGRARTDRSAWTLVAAVLVLALAAQPGASMPTDPAEVYVETTAPLEPPEWEGGPTEIEMVDLDRDGHVDLVTVGDHGSPFVNSDLHGISVWFGDGTGAFTVQQTGDFGYGGVAIGDVDLDGHLDVAFGVHHDYSDDDFGDQLLEVALGDGTGTGWTPWDDGLATDGETWGMFGTDFADVDADGDLDVGSVSFGCCNGWRVYENHGDGTWTPFDRVAGGNADMLFGFGDVDNDGWPDLAAVHQAGSIYLGDGKGKFTLSESGLPSPGTIGRRGTSLGDVDGDARDDVGWIDEDGGPRVFRRTPEGTWIDWTGALPGTGPYDLLELHDMNGDALADVVAFGDGQGQVWLGDGSGGWTAAGTFSTPQPGNGEALRVGGDLDRNGYPDIVALSEEGGLFTTQNHLHVWLEDTAASDLTIRIVAPRGGRTLRSGMRSRIHWASAVPGGLASTVRIERSLTGDAGPWTIVADGIPDNGRHEWTVPDVDGADLRLRLTTTSDGSSSNATSAATLTLAPGADAIRVRFDSPSALRWDDRTARSEFRVYRGDWEHFLATGEYTQDPAVVPAAEQWCSAPTGGVDDAFEPLSGALAFYLVTGVTDGSDGFLGTASDTSTRENTNRCP